MARALTGMPGAWRVNFGAGGDLLKQSQKTVAPFPESQSTDFRISPTMAEHLSREERLGLIHQNLQEVLKPDIIEQIVLKEDRPLKIYWGMAKLDR